MNTKQSKPDSVEVELIIETVADRPAARLKVAGLCYCCCVAEDIETDMATALLDGEASQR